MPRRASSKTEKKKHGARRPIWTGSMSFGLVNVPVRMYSAVSQKEVHFHQLHDADGARIKQERVCTADGKTVPYEHIVKGYELSPGHYVEVTEKDLEAFEPKARKVIDIEDFVALHEVDPIYYEHTYYLAPDKGASKPYALLHAALVRREKVGVARVVLWNKQRLCVIRPLGDAISLSTLQYFDEILPTDGLEDLPSSAEKPRERELSMAEQIIESLSARFRPEKYHDEYREKVLDFLKRKAEGGEVVAPPEPKEEAPQRDLMEALKASLAAVRSPRRPANESTRARVRAKPRPATPRRTRPAKRTSKAA